MKRLLMDFIRTFIIVLAVSSIVTFLYNFLLYGESIISFGTPIRLAVILGIVLPWSERRHETKYQQVA